MRLFPAAIARIATALLLLLATPARGDDPEDESILPIPIECLEFWAIPGSASSPVAWDAMLSFAACIQDASVHRVDKADQLESFVESLQAALGPALQLYRAAIEEAPGPTKLRAAYYIALGQVALVTRARSSIVSPALRQPLEAFLEPHARLAYLLFTTIERSVIDNPKLAPDAVTRYMVRSAREHASALRNSVSTSEHSER